MAIIALNFLKIAAERNKVRTGQMKINNNVNIKKVEKSDISLGKEKQSALRFEFECKSTYDPEIGSILIQGEVIDLRDEDVVKEAVEAWEKGKKIDQKIIENVMSNILTKSSMEALILAKDLGLPSPVELPKIKRSA